MAQQYYVDRLSPVDKYTGFQNVSEKRICLGFYRTTIRVTVTNRLLARLNFWPRLYDMKLGYALSFILHKPPELNPIEGYWYLKERMRKRK